MFYVTDLRHFEGIELDPDVPGPALSLALYLRRIVRSATASSSPGAHPTALACRRRPQRHRCPGHLRVELQGIPSCIEWGCPACGEGGRIDGWQGSRDDLSSLSRQVRGDESGRELVIAEELYPLLVEEESFDSRCARMVYTTTTGRGGVLLCGTDGEFGALSEVAMAWAQDEPSASRRRRWRQLVQSFEPRRRSWLDQRIDVMADELAALGLHAPRARLGAKIQNIVAEVAESLGISESSARRYLDDERLRQLAQEAALQLGQEQPGAVLLDLPRTIPLAVGFFGRVVSALAEAARIRVLNSDELGAQDALDLLSALGRILHEARSEHPGAIHLPQAALIRTGRFLEASAEVVTAGGDVGAGLPIGEVGALADALLADARSLRALVSEHGTSTAPTADS
ncbi:MAG: hypothetical protein M0Z46_21860 [Actinomycetota bacterium]|nr:hypothetical protein [Actinomycetota bacterium]